MRYWAKRNGGILHNFTGSAREVAQFYGSSYGKILILCGWKDKFLGLLKLGGFLEFFEICDSHGQMHSSCHGVNFYCGLQNFLFCVHLCLWHMHYGPPPHLVFSSCEYFMLLDGCIALWSSDDRNPWLPTKEVQRANECNGERVWKTRNTKPNTGLQVLCFHANTSLFMHYRRENYWE